MSHFTTIKTRIKDIAALRAACQELGLGVEENAEARGYYTNKTRGDHVIRLKGPYDVALNRGLDGTYGLTADWWNGHVEKEVGPNFGRLLQLYAVHKATVEARKKGIPWPAGLDPALVAREKAGAVKKGGLLEFVEPTETLDGIGGLDRLKGWLLKRRNAFGRKARDYGLPAPKGTLILGVPGCGKSLTAKAAAKAFGLPLLKLDAGRIFGGLVGQSEANMRQVIGTAEAVAPCVVWIDELDKMFAGGKSSGAADGGTSSRVFGSLLNWMQERAAPVFVVATANDVSQLPPELLRKGRWDELWFVDLPTREEREAIWKIQIAKYGRDPGDFDPGQLARASDGYTGAEIEQAFVEALHLAFDAGDEPTDLTVGMVLAEAVPLSRLMAEPVMALRQWAKGRARPATTPEAPPRGRRIAA